MSLVNRLLKERVGLPLQPDAGCPMPDAGCLMPDARYQMPDWEINV